MKYIFTFTEGIFAFISPCILPMLPIFLAYISADKKRSVKSRFINTFFFVLGFTFAFSLMGSTAFAIGKFFSVYKSFLVKAAGVIMVFLGFVYLDIINFSIPISLNKKKGDGLLSNFVFGIAYSFAWTPCLSTFLASALALAAVQSTAMQGISLLICFGLGLGIPFILFAVFYEKLQSVTIFFKKNGEKVKYAGGIMLIIFGISMVFDLFGYYVSFFS